MSGSLNKVSLIGNLGADPEVRAMNSGGEVVSFSLATSERWKGRDGEQKEQTEWHRIVIFNEPLGKVAKQYLRKGSSVYIEGKLQTRKWTDQAGVDKYSTEVVLQAFGATLVLLGTKQDPGRSDYGAHERGRTPSGGAGGSSRSGPSPFDSDLDDDVPF